MSTVKVEHDAIRELIRTALEEDIREGDHTTLATIPEGATGAAELVAKQGGIIAGLEEAKVLVEHFDSSLSVREKVTDGTKVEAGTVILVLEGNVRSILSIERVLLNLVQRMSGVATMTRKYAQAIEHTNATVLDTRKTTPGMRWFEKRAVVIGGGENHRFGLFDMILIKDNHIDASGSISGALNDVYGYLEGNQLPLKVEVEVRSLNDVKEVLKDGRADRIMLDNFSVAQTKDAIQEINGRMETESSGGINLETIKAYAETGVDFISVGALTHSVKALDISLKIKKV